MLPSGWTKRTVADICEFQNGNGFEPGQWSQAGLPIIRIQNLNGSRSFNYFAGTPDERWIVNPGQLLFAWAGTRGVSFGPFQWNGDRGVLNQHIFKVTARNGIETDWLLLALRNVTDKIESRAHGFKATLLHVKKSDIESQTVLTPPRDEQLRIANAVSTWESAIDVIARQLANARARRLGLMQSLLTGRNRFADYSGNWKMVSIGDVLKQVRRPVEWDDEAIYTLLSVKRRSEGIVVREALRGAEIATKKMNVARAGDFLISKMQIVHGASALVTPEYDGMHVSDSYVALTSDDPESFDIRFFDWLSKTPLMYRQALLCSYGVHIEKMTFDLGLYLREKIQIPPSIGEQRRIVEVLETAEHETTGLLSTLVLLKQEKKALMKQLLTGKRRVKSRSAS